MNDQKTHWRKIVESDYLAGADLDDGHGNHPAITVTIANARPEKVMDPGTKKEESCLILKFQEPQYKPMICNATNAKAISKATGSEYIQDWGGRQITIGTEKVRAFGEIWDALRVKPFAPKPATTAQTAQPCADCKLPIQDSRGVTASTIAAGTMKAYGRPLCISCADKAKQATAQPTAEPEQDGAPNVE